MNKTMGKKGVNNTSRARVTSYWLFAVFVVFVGFGFQARAQTGSGKDTLISGQMQAVNNGPLAGVIVIEDGRLYGKNFKYGGAVDEHGRFSVKVPKGGDYGLHLYATDYIYYPLSVKVKTGEDNRFTFIMPPNAAPKDAPVISQVSFKLRSEVPDKVVIRLSVHDPNHNLSHQVLGTNIVTQEGFVFSPPKFVFPWTRDYPEGVYTLTYDTRGRPFDPLEWYFVAADNRCYNSPVLRHPFTAEGVVASRAVAKAKPKPPRTEPIAAADAAQMIERGRTIFANNCTICHYAEREKTKVGPGLKGLFKKRLTPSRKVSVSEKNIRAQIQQGSELMPPYAHIGEEELPALLAYLKSL